MRLVNTKGEHYMVQFHMKDLWMPRWTLLHNLCQWDIMGIIKGEEHCWLKIYSLHFFLLPTKHSPKMHSLHFFLLNFPSSLNPSQQTYLDLGPKKLITISRLYFSSYTFELLIVLIFLIFILLDIYIYIYIYFFLINYSIRDMLLINTLFLFFFFFFLMQIQQFPENIVPCGRRCIMPCGA